VGRTFFEDLEVGQRFGGASYSVARDETIAWGPMNARRARC
jgi:hypothetical protein